MANLHDSLERERLFRDLVANDDKLTSPQVPGDSSTADLDPAPVDPIPPPTSGSSSYERYLADPDHTTISMYPGSSSSS